MGLGGECPHIPGSSEAVVIAPPTKVQAQSQLGLGRATADAGIGLRGAKMQPRLETNGIRPCVRRPIDCVDRSPTGLKVVENATDIEQSEHRLFGCERVNTADFSGLRGTLT
jgi:hypothetical protein